MHPHWTRLLNHASRLLSGGFDNFVHFEDSRLVEAEEDN